jgi:hypothetical protein
MVEPGLIPLIMTRLVATCSAVLTSRTKAVSKAALAVTFWFMDAKSTARVNDTVTAPTGSCGANGAGAGAFPPGVFPPGEFPPGTFPPGTFPAACSSADVADAAAGSSVPSLAPVPLLVSTNTATPMMRQPTSNFGKML